MLSCLLLAFRFSKVITSTARVSKPFQEKFHITLLLFSFSTPRCAGLEEAEKNARICMNMLSLNGPQILVYSFLWYGVARSGSAICCSLMSVLRSLKYLSYLESFKHLTWVLHLPHLMVPSWRAPASLCSSCSSSSSCRRTDCTWLSIATLLPLANDLKVSLT